jgi:hypothetical protein
MTMPIAAFKFVDTGQEWFVSCRRSTRCGLKTPRIGNHKTPQGSGLKQLIALRFLSNELIVPAFGETFSNANCRADSEAIC